MTDVVCHRCQFTPPEGMETLFCPRDGLRLIDQLDHERAPRDMFLGTSLGGKYPMLGLVRQLAIGAVYHSIQPPVDREVLIRIFPPSSGLAAPGARDAFLAGAKAIAKVSHPALATLFDFGVEHDGTAFLVTDRAAGRTLAEAMPDADRCLDLAAQILEALEVAHGAGVFHGELSPEAVLLLDEAASQYEVSVLDLGAWSLAPNPGEVPASPHYMAPERASTGQGSAASDTYSLGVILFEALAGKRPFDGDQVLAVIDAHKSQPVPSLPARVPSALASVVTRALAKDPADRFASAAAMAAALRDARTDATKASPPGRTVAEAPSEPEPVPEALGAVVEIAPEPPAAARLELDDMLADFWEEEPDEWDEEEQELPAPFSLFDKIAAEHADAAGDAGAAPPEGAVLGLEVYRVFGGELDEADLVTPGGAYHGPLGGLVASYPGDGLPKASDGTTLEPGDTVDVSVDGVSYRLRLSEVPVVPKGSGAPLVSRRGVSMGAVAIGAHALVIFLATVLLPTKEIAAGLDLRRFARIEIIDPAEPEEEEKEEEEEEEESEDKRPEKAKKKTPKAKKKASKSKFAGGGGVLGALQRFNKAKIGKTSVAAMISGISAVKGRSGAGGFQVAGTGEGIPGGKLVVGGRAGGAGLRTGTRGIKDLFAKGARAKLKGRKGSKVRGQVRAQKRSVRMKGTGSLDKALIAKVVAKNIGQVRYCYERTLLKEPSIRGKVVLEWSIGLSGKVTRVKEKFSSLNSSAMTGCIIGKVKGWKFPKPRGGQVIVSYPFIFNSVGF